MMTDTSCSVWSTWLTIGTIAEMASPFAVDGETKQEKKTLRVKSPEPPMPFLHPRAHHVRGVHVAVDVRLDHAVAGDDTHATDGLGVVRDVHRAKEDLRGVLHGGVDVGAEWQPIVEELAGESAEVLDLIAALSEAGVAAPDGEVGYELDGVPFELVWTSEKIAVQLDPAPDVEVDGWRILAPDAASIAAAWKQQTGA